MFRSLQKVFLTIPRSSRLLSLAMLAAVPVTAASLMGILPGAANAQGAIAGKPLDGTPKPGFFVSGPLRWGRLVDIWALDNNGVAGPILRKQGATFVTDPLYLDVVVGDAFGVSKTLATSVTPPVQLTLNRDATSGSQVVIINTTFSKSPKSTFQKVLAEITGSLGTIAVGGPTSLPPYSMVPRDAAIVINFDRPLNPKTVGPETIQMFAGSATATGKLPPAPFLGRIIFKREQPRRIVIDPTISAVDSARISEELANAAANPKTQIVPNPQVLPLNSLGLAASTISTKFNIGLFIPSQYDISKGVTKILLARDGTALDINKSITKYIYNSNPNSTSLSEGITGVARVFRAGGAIDPNQGFLADTSSPAIIGTQQVLITAVNDFVAGDKRVVTFQYLNAPCDLSVRVGDSMQQGGLFGSVAAVDSASMNDADPSYTVTLNYLQASTFNTVDPGLITTQYAESFSSRAGCFIITQPQPAIVTNPPSGIDPQVAFTLRFSKPMEPTRVNPLRNFCVLTNPNLASPAAANDFELIVGNLIPSPDLRSYRFVPYLPLPHTNGVSETYRLMVLAGTGGITDLAGNPLTIPETSFQYAFTLRADAASNTSRNLNIRFDSLLVGGGPATLVTGQVTKPSATEIGPRSVSHFSREVDQSNPFISVMSLFTTAGGVQTPLAALGSRLQTVYRHMDMNLSLNQLSDIDLDVERLWWNPQANDLKVSDFFENIRIDLSHSNFAPDEFINPSNLLPQFPFSGLSTGPFSGNNFELAVRPPVAVYQGPYSINFNLLQTAQTGTVFMPWPQFQTTYTWRDSTYGSKRFGAPNGDGVNPDQYFQVLGLTQPNAGTSALKPYGANAVPSVGLPLLMDFRIYPADDPNTKGLNGFQVTLAVTSSSLPSFRVFSTGGLNTALAPKTVVPDVAPDGTSPTGGYFPPGSTAGTPGTKTGNQGPEVYLGKVDLVTRVSHVFSRFYNLTSATVTVPKYVDSNVIVLPSIQPPGTSIQVGYRSAQNITPVNAFVLTDARSFDAYGDAYTGGTTPPTIPPPILTSGFGTITGLLPASAASSTENYLSSISSHDGRGFLQMRFTFISDIVNNVSPAMNAFGIAYSNQ